MEKNIVSQIELIDKYLDAIHNQEGTPNGALEEPINTKPVIEIILNPTNISTKETKVPLDMKLLQQRIDSVSVIKYYKDLKNERIRDEDVRLETDVDDVFTAVQASADNKPWPRLDKYSKKKKIQQFVDKLLEQSKIEDKLTVLEELYQMLETKKINKKTIDLDVSNDIVRLGDYSLF